MISEDVINQLTESRRRIPSNVWKKITLEFSQNENPTPESIATILKVLTNQDALWILNNALKGAGGTSWGQVAGAMMAIDQAVGSSESVIDIIWTGPANGRFPVRRTDQVLYDLISAAQKRIVLVTFAAHRIKHLCAHLATAVNRGVKLTLIVESEDESGGQLSVDAIKAFRELPLGKTTILNWPFESREKNLSGRPGKLHAKCAIVDDTAIVGSANLTDDAFNRNMELGVLIKDPSLVQTLDSHFDELFKKGVLKILD
jgi:phosphatidylserine/phosphatidylglycerophosphate/cardiolipin synthase-like enzyme